VYVFLCFFLCYVAFYFFHVHFVYHRAVARILRLIHSEKKSIKLHVGLYNDVVKCYFLHNNAIVDDFLILYHLPARHTSSEGF